MAPTLISRKQTFPESRRPGVSPNKSGLFDTNWIHVSHSPPDTCAGVNYLHSQGPLFTNPTVSETKPPGIKNGANLIIFNLSRYNQNIFLSRLKYGKVNLFSFKWGRVSNTGEAFRSLKVSTKQHG
jgi:hypothetical protein